MGRSGRSPLPRTLRTFLPAPLSQLRRASRLMTARSGPQLRSTALLLPKLPKGEGRGRCLVTVRVIPSGRRPPPGIRAPAPRVVLGSHRRYPGLARRCTSGPRLWGQSHPGAPFAAKSRAPGCQKTPQAHLGGPGCLAAPGAPKPGVPPPGAPPAPPPDPKPRQRRRRSRKQAC